NPVRAGRGWAARAQSRRPRRTRLSACRGCLQCRDLVLWRATVDVCVRVVARGDEPANTLVALQMKRRSIMMIGTAGAIGIAAAIGIEGLWFTPAGIPDRFESLPAGIVITVTELAQARSAQTSDGGMQFDFSDETVGAEPKSF